MGKSIVISKVHNGSVANKAGIEQGDVLLSINGQYVQDVFDYGLITADEILLLEVMKSDGKIVDVKIEKDEYEELGLDFENPLMDEAMRCKNKCIFCFIDQLPKNMRKTLYFKDDDVRLSFLTGNYVTLTNITKEQLNRIIQYRMSPINVSVHTTNPELRCFMLNNKTAGDVVDKIRMLVENRITVNCQIVLCRGVNDEKELDDTIYQLGCFYPGIESISVVPVGLSKYRDNLEALKPYDSKSSNQLIKQICKWQSNFLKKHGSRIVYIADEFYILAGMKLPEVEEYEDFPQIENGVGLVALFREQFYNYYYKLNNFKCKNALKREVSIVTGKLAHGYFKEFSEKIEQKFGVKVYVYPIENNFFGKDITVAGLLTFTDIASGLKGNLLGDEVLIPECVLRYESDVFLDDFKVEMLQDKLKVKVAVVRNDGEAFLKKVLGL